MQRAQGFAQQGGETVFTAGIASTTLAQASFPLATITVYYTGTAEPAFLYSDNQQFPTPMSNPFTADENGHWFFYAPNGRYDVMIASPELDAPWTISDILLYDPPAGGGGGGGDVPQTPWTSNIDGAGFNLSNVGYIDVTGGYLINGVPMANPNLWVQVPSTANIYHQGFIGVAMTSPNYAVDVVGGVNVTDRFYINGVAIGTGTSNDPWTVLSGNRIQYNGQVGISIAPAHALDVVGDVNITGQYFINGVAIGGGGGTNPWIVLTGSRINYNGQVGVNNSNPGYAMDVVGSINCTTGFFVNGVAISTGGGAGLWIPGSNGIIFYNGGNVGIGTNAPVVALQVPGTIAGGQYSMAGNPSNAVINANGAFVGAGVQVGAFGVGCASVTSTGPVHCGAQTAPPGPAFEGNGDGWFNGNCAANTFSLYNSGNPGSPLINASGQFVGAGAATGSFGMSAAYFQANVVSGVAGSGNIVATNFLEAANGIVISGFAQNSGVVINSAGAFQGAGVQVGAYGVGCGSVTCSGPVDCQPDGTGVALRANGNGWFNGLLEANGFGLYQGGSPGLPLINSNGAFVGAGVDVRGGGGFGLAAMYIESDGNIVANTVSGVNSGFVYAAAGFIVPAYGIVINSAGAWVGAGVETGANGIGGAYIQANVVAGVANSGSIVALNYLEAVNGLVINGNLVINSAGQFLGTVSGSLSSLTINGQLVITSGWQFTGSGGVLTTGLVQGTSIYASGGNVQSSLGYICANSPVSGGTVIDSQGVFTGYGINMTGSVVCGPVTSSGGLTLNGNGDTLWMRTATGGLINCASNGIWTGSGVQTNADIFSGLYGIEAGGGAGSPGNFLGLTANSGNQFTLTTSLGELTVRVIGGIICAG